MTVNRTADELLAHLEEMKASGVDLSKVECWGWDDGTIVFAYDESEDYSNLVKNFEASA